MQLTSAAEASLVHSLVLHTRPVLQQLVPCPQRRDSGHPRQHRVAAAGQAARSVEVAGSATLSHRLAAGYRNAAAAMAAAAGDAANSQVGCPRFAVAAVEVLQGAARVARIGAAAPNVTCFADCHAAYDSVALPAG